MPSGGCACTGEWWSWGRHLGSSVGAASATARGTSGAAAVGAGIGARAGVGGEGAEWAQAGAEAERFVIGTLSGEMFHKVLAAEARGVAGGNLDELLRGKALVAAGLALREAHGDLQRRRCTAGAPHRGHHHPGTGVARQVGMRDGELVLQLRHLPLQHGDGAHAAINGVLDARVGFVRQRIHCVLALVHRELVQQLGDIAGAKYLMDIGEFVRLVRREVGCEYAFCRTLATQKLACGARRARRGRRHSWLTRSQTSSGTAHPTFSPSLSLFCPLPKILAESLLV